MPASKDTQRTRRNDLRLVPFLQTPVAVDSELGPQKIRSARSGSGAASVTDLFTKGSAFETFVRSALEYNELLACGQGAAALAAMHLSPMREVSLDGRVHLLSHFSGDGGRSVAVHATWEVTRLQNKALGSGQLIEVDDFPLPSDQPRLERLLRQLAAASRFRPEHPRAHAALLMTTKAMDLSPTAPAALTAAAAVSDVQVRVLEIGDPSDATYRGSLDKDLAANNHHLLILFHDQEKWAWKRFKVYQGRPGRAAIAVDPRLGDVGLDMCQIALMNAVDGSATRPTLSWGPAALERIDRRTGPGFELSTLARQHLLSNLYPNVERMLQFLEKLADLAQAFHDRAPVHGRLADWAHVEFGLDISLHDENIEDSVAFFEFGGASFCNRPHVKVDDFKNPRECGRIYFGLDDVARRIIVDYVGLHDRY